MGFPKLPSSDLPPQSFRTESSAHGVHVFLNEDSENDQDGKQSNDEIFVPFWPCQSQASVLEHLKAPLQRHKATYLYETYRQRWNKMVLIYKNQLRSLHDKLAPLAELRLLIDVMSQKMATLETNFETELQEAMENLEPRQDYPELLAMCMPGIF